MQTPKSGDESVEDSESTDSEEEETIPLKRSKVKIKTIVVSFMCHACFSCTSFSAVICQNVPVSSGLNVLGI